MVQTVNCAFGIFLAIKGSPPVSSYIKEQYSAVKDAQDATLASLCVSTPQLDLSMEL